MKKHSFITKLAVAAAVAAVPLSVYANGSGPGNSQDLTATGSIRLSSPNKFEPAGVIQGGLSSNVAFRAVVRQGSGQKITTPSVEEGTETYSGTLGITRRVTNRSIIEAALDTTDRKELRGKILVLLHDGNQGPRPRLAVYDRGAKALIEEVDDNIAGGVSIDFDWIDFIGVYRGNGVVSRTVSDTSVIRSGSLRGFTGYDATLNYDNLKIPMMGVGSFVQNTRGITGRANIAGAFAEPND